MRKTATQIITAALTAVTAGFAYEIGASTGRATAAKTSQYSRAFRDLSIMAPLSRRSHRQAADREWTRTQQWPASPPGGENAP